VPKGSQDPIAKYVPAFGHLKVFRGDEMRRGNRSWRSAHAPTIEELMSHTAGCRMGTARRGGCDVQQQKVMQSASLEEMVDKLGTIPLNYEPGKNGCTRRDGCGGYIVERLSGETLRGLLCGSISSSRWGWKDAGFFVPLRRRARFATNYKDDTGWQAGAGAGWRVVRRPLCCAAGEPSGGGGLVSTAEDYYRFAQMLANGGELDGKRVLAPATVKLMTSNHLPATLLTGEWGIGST